MIEVTYRTSKGRDPKGGSKDVIVAISWSGQPDWMTSRGISTANALSNPQGVIDAYPGALVARFDDGRPKTVLDDSLGIEIDWKEPATGDELTVEIRIFPARNPAKKGQSP